VMQTIYLRLSAENRRADVGAAHPDASLCMDLNGGAFAPGTVVQTWGCNSCWNQQFILGGGVTQQSRWREVTADQRDPSVGTCPPVPSPPSKACDGEWPSFSSAAALSASPWAAYIQDVYGAVPQNAQYPWCMGDLWALYSDRITAHGIKTPASVGKCPTNDGKTNGQLYSVNNQFQPSNMEWIWHPGPLQPFSDNDWVEVIHMKFVGDEHVGAWFFYARGSGVWFNTGKTIHFVDHGDAYKMFDAHGNEDMSAKAAAAGYDSVQFLAHSDCEFKACRTHKGTATMNFEIVATKLKGMYSCTSSSGTSDLIRSGWQGANTCTCDNSQNNLNCKSVPVQPVRPPLGTC